MEIPTRGCLGFHRVSGGSDGTTSGCGLPRWQVQQVTVVSASWTFETYWALMFLVIRIIVRADCFSRLASFGKSYFGSLPGGFGTWQWPQSFPMACLKRRIVSSSSGREMFAGNTCRLWKCRSSAAGGRAVCCRTAVHPRKSEVARTIGFHLIRE